MRERLTRILPILAAGLLYAAVPSFATVLPPPGPEAGLANRGRNVSGPSALEHLGNDVIRIGKVIVNKKERSLSFPALINMDQGLLEYVLVRSGGKTHESLLRTEAEPCDIQIGCLLLNLVGSQKPLEHQGSAETPTGDGVTLTVAVRNSDGSRTEVPPETWVRKVAPAPPREPGRQADPLQWVYAGSLIVEGRFMSQVDGSVVALYHDPVAIIDNGSPGGENDKVWFVNEKTVPAAGTPVTITIKPAGVGKKGGMLK
jgi:hypothetical protein